MTHNVSALTLKTTISRASDVLLIEVGVFFDRGTYGSTMIGPKSKEDSWELL